MALLTAPVPKEFTEQISASFWRISVARYHEMIQAGLLTEDDRLELLEGYLIEKMTVKPPHAFVTEILRDLLSEFVPENFFVNAQQPMTTSDSEPEPDVMIIKGERRDFLSHHPSAPDVALLVEVADATLRRDQTWKKEIYARAGVAIYWIVNLPERQIEVYTDPSKSFANPTYRQLQTYFETDEVPVVLDGVEIGRLSVQDLLP